MSYDLLVCIRACAQNSVDLVIDTLQSVEYCCSPGVKVVIAVDGPVSKYSEKVHGLFGADRVYLSTRHWGWGAGLFSLFINSYLHFRGQIEFNHFCSIDYDTLFISKGADKLLLDSIQDDKVGLIGCHNKKNEHWKEIFDKGREEFISTFGDPGPRYIAGEGVQGGLLLATNSLLREMEQRNMFKPPYSVARNHTCIADDHLLPIFVRMCGLEIQDVSRFASCYWNAKCDPRGLEEKGIAIFHPTKLRANNKNKSTEITIRNYFRKLRGCADLLV
jgi:hypothetical protein